MNSLQEDIAFDSYLSEASSSTPHSSESKLLIVPRDLPYLRQTNARRVSTHELFNRWWIYSMTAYEFVLFVSRRASLLQRVLLWVLAWREEAAPLSGRRGRRAARGGQGPRRRAAAGGGRGHATCRSLTTTPPPPTSPPRAKTNGVPTSFYLALHVYFNRIFSIALQPWEVENEMNDEN